MSHGAAASVPEGADQTVDVAKKIEEIEAQLADENAEIAQLRAKLTGG